MADSKSQKTPGIGGGGPGSGPRSLIQGKKVRAKDIKGTLLRIWKYLGSRKGALALALSFIALSTAAGLIGPYMIAQMIDQYISPGITEGLKEMIFILIAIYIVSALSTWLYQYLMIDVSQKAVKKVRTDLFHSIQGLSLRYFDQTPNGEIMSRLTNDVDNINVTLSESVGQLFSSVITLIGVITIMFIMSWQMALISMLAIPMIFFVVKFIANKTRAHYRAQQKHLGTLNGMIEETLTGQKVVKAYGQEEKVIAQFKVINQNLKEASIKAETFGGMMGPSMNLTNNLRFAIIVGAGGVLGIYGLVSIGVLAAFISYSRQFGRPMTQIANTYNTIQAAIAGAERVFQTMDEKVEVVDSEEALDLEHIDGKVQFKDVDFGYIPGVQVLKEANFVANPGDTIAIVGPTGAGKTTIINLLTRFYDIDKGSITIDGLDIRKMKKHQLRKKLGIVLQDTYLFSESVRENIRYGRLNATDQEVEEAAKLAYADHFIRHLPEGYDTILSQEGSNLSQGQRQLLAIARAILSDPDILILDEATSSVDTRTEVHIQKAMLHLMEGRTSFVIAHRLSTIKDATMIMVVNQGEIIEKGDHQSLLKNKGFYYDLYHSQFQHKSLA